MKKSINKTTLYKLMFSYLLIVFSIIFVSCGKSDKDVLETESITYYWYNADGKEYHKEDFNKGEKVTNPRLPVDNDKWDYIEWQKKTDTTFYAVREPKDSYFQGNVFQIVIKDLGGTPVSTGSGFVFNSEGWFITNAHVMDGAYFAKAVFDIPNSQLGESYTYLDISSGTYYDEDKDIFIGQIDDYESIQAYYKEIPIELTYNMGDTTYSVGYPKSSTELKINKGNITETWSDLYEKLYSGNTYICSSSYIAPGSSGGILVDSELRVIGITTLGWTNENDEFVSGAAISAFNFRPALENTNEEDLELILNIYHRRESVFIKYFIRALQDHSSGKATSYRSEKDNAIVVRYEWTERTSSGGISFEYNYMKEVNTNGLIVFTCEVYTSNGHEKRFALGGYYDSDKVIDNFSYLFEYYYPNGKWYALRSQNINYSSEPSLSLHEYTTSKSNGYVITNSDVLYAKEEFNTAYSMLLRDLFDLVPMP